MRGKELLQVPRSKRAVPTAREAVDAWMLLEAVVSPDMKPVLERIAVRQLAYHSAGVVPGTLFFCLTGGKEDGHAYAREAASRGAAAVVASRQVTINAPLVLVPDTRFALSLAAAHFFGFPALKMKMIGVTGTNGKTTTTYFIQSIFQAAGHRAAILGSNGLLLDGLERSFNLTTPQSLELQESLAFLHLHGAGAVAVEASSHALEQQRLSHCAFDRAVFTNLTREHLDYHGTMQAYLQAKAKLFALLKDKPESRAILNADDCYYRRLSVLSGDPSPVTYGIRAGEASVRAVELAASPAGKFSFKLAGWPALVPVSLQLPGLYNVYNALAAAAAAWAEVLPPEAVAGGLSALQAVPGRFEEIAGPRGVTVIIDYAHTPDGLEQVLKLLRSRRTRKIITLFGCPGERDRGKRPLMGHIAEQYSDRVVLTADNPAGEDAAAIMREIAAGMRSAPALIADRREAVHHVLSSAGPGDLVLLAGKGAEEHQLVGGKALPYSDRKTVEEYLALRGER
jgi:UDP-N-acetylmuramoyl-L-alanyl-D-glutamate--2,6-diaminopimelate ligase